MNYQKCIRILLSEKYLFLYIIFGHFYVIISSINGFGYYFSFETDLKYLFRQSYFLPFLAIVIPSLVISSKHGLMKFLKEYYIHKFAFFISSGILILYYLKVFENFQYLLLIIILLSIRHRLISILLFIPIFIYPVVTNQLSGIEYGLQYQLMTIVAAFFFFFNFSIKRKAFVYIVLLLFGILFGIGRIFDDIYHNPIFYLFTDNNAIWRLDIWIKNINYTIFNTFGLGVGLGTSYFLSDVIPTGTYWANFVGPDYMGNPYHEDYVTGQHNSIVNVFYRFGLIGLMLFIAFISNIYKKIKINKLPEQYYLILSIILITISVNVGLESPRYMLMFVMYISVIISRSYDEQHLKIIQY